MRTTSPLSAEDHIRLPPVSGLARRHGMWLARSACNASIAKAPSYIRLVGDVPVDGGRKCNDARPPRTSPPAFRNDGAIAFLNSQHNANHATKTTKKRLQVWVLPPEGGDAPP